jgi:hypothetical protein
MIALVGQYYITFDLGGKKDFILDSELNEFTLIEESGGKLPTFLLEFNTYDDSILPKLNESTPLSVVTYKDTNDDTFIDTPLNITSLTQIPNGNGSYTINIRGIFDNPEYLSVPSINITSPKSGVSAAIEVASNTFKKVDSNVTTSLDSQRWIQHNTTDRAFISNALLHANGAATSYAHAITVNGDFRIRDIKRSLLTSVGINYDWRFTMQPKIFKDIAYDGNPVVTANTGFLNSLVGYGREVIEQLLDSGTSSNILEKPEQIMALTKELARKSSIDKRFGGTVHTSDNVHSEYWSAYWRNLANLMMLGNITVELTFDKDFKDVHPLDMVMLDIPSTDSRYNSEYLAGMYLVSKVSRTLSESKYSTTVWLCRESLNQVRVS